METPGGHLASLPELVEKVLFEHPVEDLLFSQRVCCGWKQIIDKSPNLQRARFFRPAREGAASLVYPNGLVPIRDCIGTCNGAPAIHSMPGCLPGNVPPEDLEEAFPAHWGSNANDCFHHRIFKNPFIERRRRFFESSLTFKYGGLSTISLQVLQD